MSSQACPIPPGPTPAFPGQHVIAFRRDPIAFLQRLAREYGDVASFRLGPQRIILLNHPDLIRDVLVTNAHHFYKGRGLERAKRLLGEGLLTSEEEFHRRQRRLVQPAFHRQRLTGYAETMVQYADRAGRRWADGATVDMADEMMRLTLPIVGKTLFNAEIGAEAEQISGAVGEVIALFHLLMLPYAERLERLPLPAVRRFRSARARLDAVIYRMIREHRERREDQGDLLSMLLEARDEDAGRMTDLQVRDEAMTLFLAGYETTANALTWTWYLLSQHPEAEARLHQELDAVLGRRLPTLDDLPRLLYTRHVFTESVRLYPPAWVIGRRVVAPYTLAGYDLPPDTIMLLCQSVTHRDARWFPDPDRFDPDRWREETAPERPKFAFFPFGGGARTCIGEQFAWMEGVLLLATLAPRWRMRFAPGQRVGWQPIITLRPRYPMRVTLRARA